MKWEQGRQGTGYEKITILSPNNKFIPADFYVIRYPTGSYIPPHQDKVEGRRHFRINIEIIKAKRGGQFICNKTILSIGRLRFFRPDTESHMVTKIESGQRIILSLGWTLTGQDW